jgi:putative pyruvate formate lyase activating enzyme
MSYPSYLDEARSGRLERKVREAVESLRSCRTCPRECGVDRLQDQPGFCRTGRRARVASYGAHHGEEDVLRGSRGSGTLFFSGCNLACQFCQNWDISQQGRGGWGGKEDIAAMALELQEAGCHNLNLVTPEHVVPQVLEALQVGAERGLRLPVVYNTSAYDSLESLRLLDGAVDIYMPDLKCLDPGLCARYLKAADYAETAKAAIREMRRQVGDLEIDPDTGLARRGVLLRHLVMPDCLEDSSRIFRWIAEELSPDTFVNVMGQYHPGGAVALEGVCPELNRPLGKDELREARALAKGAGLRRVAPD